MPKKKLEVKKRVGRPKKDAEVKTVAKRRGRPPKVANVANPVGRPAVYNQEVAEELCLKIATSSRGLKHICDNNPDMPCRQTVFTWMLHNKKFLDMYEFAKRVQVELLADEALDITHSDHPDYDNPARARLKFDIYKWHAEKLKPNKYGTKEKIDQLEDAQKEMKEQMKELRAKLSKKHKKEY